MTTHVPVMTAEVLQFLRPERGGLFVDMMSHTLDFLDYMFGPIEKVCALAGNQAGAYRANG